MQPEIAMIVVMGENRAIGKDNQLLWKIPADLKRFRDLTLGHPLIMGRKTFESIGKPLPHRTNIVVSRSSLSIDGCATARSLEEAIALGKMNDKEKVFVIGGGQIYEQALPLTDRLYLTLVEKVVPDADTFFPDYSDFKKIVSDTHWEQSGLQFKFLELQK